MDDWQERHIKCNLPLLIKLTDCNVQLLAHLIQNQLFSQEDIAQVEAKSTPQAKANLLYNTAIMKVNGYDVLAFALQATKQTGALKIMMTGYQVNNMPTPDYLIVDELDHNLTFMWKGKSNTLEDLLGTDVPEETFQNLHMELNKCLHHKSIQLLKPPLLPERVKFYVPRILSYIPSTELNEEIFMSESSKGHVFLLSGIDANDVARLTDYNEQFEKSWNQRHEVTCRFIIMEDADHFDRICNGTRKPVHVIQHDFGRYFWIKSRGGLRVIKQFLISERMTINEREMVSKIKSSSHCIIIADTPGMGKSMLLHNLANLLDKEQDSFVLFIRLQEFLRYIQQSGYTSTSSPIDTIIEFSSSGLQAKLVLIEMLKRTTKNIFLLFDGYDEVSQENLETIEAILRRLQEEENVKFIVTTRPHLRIRLEEMFSQFSHEILPFSNSNQVDSLTNFWINHTKHPAQRSDALVEFAKQCLRTLDKKFVRSDKNIAGIPLQCMILAEVHAEDAKSISYSKSFDTYNITPMSFTLTYGKLVDLKFKQIADSTCYPKYLNAHVELAISLLFPGWSDIFGPILVHEDETDTTTLYSIGLLEEDPTNSPQFIHRTFAEYILAEFIIKNLSKHSECIDLLLTDILGRKGVTISYGDKWMGNRIAHYTLINPVIGYFIEVLLGKHVGGESFQPGFLTTFSRLFSKTINFSDEDACVAIGACCSNDLEHTFEYVTSICSTMIENKIALRERYLKTLPHEVVEHTRNITLLNKVLDFTKSKFHVNLGYHGVEDSFKSLYIPSLTPLHVAALRGKYNMVVCLLEKYSNEDTCGDMFKLLLHLCTFFSAEDSDNVIEEKILIIDKLVGINKTWVKETDQYNLTPVLQLNVHLSLLKRLVHHGADINTYSSAYGTILHRSSLSATIYTELSKWAFAKGFKLVDYTNNELETPLMYAIRRFGRVDDDLLKQFHDRKTNLNAKNKNGHTLLFYALQYSESVTLIKTLLKLGAKVNNKKQNVAHKVMNNRRLNPTKTLKILKLLEAYGFRRFSRERL